MYINKTQQACYVSITTQDFSMIISIFITFFSMALSLAAETPDDALKREFPQWTQVGPEAQGDLNGNQTKDFAAILHRQSETGQGGDALVVVFFEKNGKFILQTKSPKATCVGCGGPKAPMGEPLGQITINPKGILSIQYEGGSRESWTDVMNWRWNDSLKDFNLIEQTTTSYDTLVENPKSSVINVNFLTLKGSRTSGRKITPCKVETKYQNQKLAEYDFEENHILDEICK
jgi:hypothetical protein